ncbi:MAG TPA: riboflavin synthase [Candidatus Dormibacteraeota bacterium]
MTARIMFSGIVTAQGEITAIDEGRISVRSDGLGRGSLQLGESIAVNGVCLTVSASAGDGFSADVMPETMRRTALGRLRPGDTVNLEAALRLGDVVGGHLVTGHVDAVGTVSSQYEDGNARRCSIEIPDRLLPLLAEKGSVAVDGISLTVVDVDSTGFTVSLIPHTLQVTTAGAWRPGSPVNIEVDPMARYVARALEQLRRNEPHPVEA